jgi:DNA-binding beta-propeller fold protein YncE
MSESPFLAAARTVSSAAVAVAFLSGAARAAAAGSGVTLRPLGTYSTGQFNKSSAEIVAFDDATDRLFVVNSQAPGVDVLDAADPTAPVKVGFIDASSLGGVVNSVATRSGIVALAIEAFVKTNPGQVALYDAATLKLLDTEPTGAQPDMLAFTPNGKFILTANEGEPATDYSVDPEGSVTMLEVSGDRIRRSRTATFAAWNGQEAALRAAGVRIFGPGATAAQDLEPEYLAVTPDNLTAYVTLQENNAIAVLDLDLCQFTEIRPLGLKDHSAVANPLDPSDRDSGIAIANWPVLGMYQPDAIAIRRFNGRDYLFTANEGDARDWSAYSEERRVKDLTLDPTAFPNGSSLRKDAQIGRLTVSRATGDTDGDGDFDELHVFGARSISVWDDAGGLVFDSGDGIEQTIAAALPAFFNSNHDSNSSFDTRSDNKGPEPEGLAIAEIGECAYLFVGLERIGGILIYDVTNPTAPVPLDYVTTRNFSGSPSGGTAGDLGPEGLVFIPAKKSPTGEPLLVVAHEVSGTTTIFAVDRTP